MRLSLHLPIAPGKKLAASFCLLAVLFLWAPGWATALHSHQMDCCAGGLCPAHGHHNNSSEPRHPSSAPMDCDHHNNEQRSSSLANCSMTCSHDSDHPAPVSNVFVLPLPAQISPPVVAVASQPQLTLTAFAHTPEPPSPPPKTTLPTL
jgi:hypothetical protein